MYSGRRRTRSAPAPASRAGGAEASDRRLLVGRGEPVPVLLARADGAAGEAQSDGVVVLGHREDSAPQHHRAEVGVAGHLEHHGGASPDALEARPQGDRAGARLAGRHPLGEQRAGDRVPRAGLRQCARTHHGECAGPGGGAAPGRSDDRADVVCVLLSAPGDSRAGCRPAGPFAHRFHSGATRLHLPATTRADEPDAQPPASCSANPAVSEYSTILVTRPPETSMKSAPSRRIARPVGGRP
jgi:hypothetical protein